MWEGILDEASRREGLPREEIMDKRCEPILFRQPQTAEDIANGVLFLSSDVSRNISGESFNISGGFRMD